MTKETQYSRCVKCGSRRPTTALIQYKLRFYCKDNQTNDKPSCYMAEFLKDLELKRWTDKEVKGDKTIS